MWTGAGMQWRWRTLPTCEEGDRLSELPHVTRRLHIRALNADSNNALGARRSAHARRVRAPLSGDAAFEEGGVARGGGFHAIAGPPQAAWRPTCGFDRLAGLVSRTHARCSRGGQ